jgi:hypothetical protein
MTKTLFLISKGNGKKFTAAERLETQGSTSCAQKYAEFNELLK